VGKQVDLRIGRIEGLKEFGGSLANLRVQVNRGTLTIPATLEPDQSVETGDLWGSLDPRVLRVFDGDGKQLRRATLVGPPPVVPAGKTTIRFLADGNPGMRVKLTAILVGCP